MPRARCKFDRLYARTPGYAPVSGWRSVLATRARTSSPPPRDHDPLTPIEGGTVPVFSVLMAPISSMRFSRVQRGLPLCSDPNSRAEPQKWVKGPEGEVLDSDRREVRAISVAILEIRMFFQRQEVEKLARNLRPIVNSLHCRTPGSAHFLSDRGV